LQNQTRIGIRKRKNKKNRGEKEREREREKKDEGNGRNADQQHVKSSATFTIIIRRFNNQRLALTLLKIEKNERVSNRIVIYGRPYLGTELTFQLTRRD